MDYAALRKKMVEEQLILRQIKDQRVLEAFSKIERHRFVPEELKINAYADFPLPIGEWQTISQPYIVALMTEYLGLGGSEKILEIGTGSGYQTAILAELAKEVYTIERVETLAKKAQTIFDELGYTNVKIKISDGTLGWQEEAPFDRIIITAASPRIPLPLTEQLREGGKMILPLGESFSQILTLVEKKNGELKLTPVCGCVFVPLIGKYGCPK
ncbi:MAG: protein-L-isoaspartate(D-aspartate) O-methyltransferase [Candidatus Omnitrophica bacterium]|nr:protein-L-isoaspartate(D-aspartate) O-methyltransferase [Candidatus Omnitrophota bacterium]